jgi:hypothetical protein
MRPKFAPAYENFIRTDANSRLAGVAPVAVWTTGTRANIGTPVARLAAVRIQAHPPESGPVIVD